MNPLHASRQPFDGADPSPSPSQAGSPSRTAPACDDREVAAGVLEKFQAWHTADRRRSPRFSPTESRVWVGWWEGGEFVIRRGNLVNLSRGGAQVVLKQRLAAGLTVWACAGSPEPVDSVEARVLDSGPAAAGPPGHVTRLKFNAPCPAGFFRAAGCGGG